jgi:autotransporter-associated beta strand protein
MNINGAYGFTLADGATLTVSGIYKTGGNAAVIGGGAALQALANGELLIRSEKANDVLTINTPIVANGMNQLTLDGPGTLILGAANTFTGNATANSGTLQLGNALALQNNTVSAALTFSPAIGTFIIGGLNAQRFLLLKDTSGNPITLQVGNNGATTTGGGFAGSGALVKIGNGAFNLSSSTFTGGTTINSGTLGIFFEDSLGGIPQSPTTNITFAGNSTLQFLNTIVSLNSNRLIAINPGVTAKIDTPDSGNLGIFIGGVISGAGALTKTGAATLTFSGANTYTGDTTLGGGALILANANALQNSTVHLGPLSFNPSIGSFTLGGLSGAGSLALTDNSGAPVALRVGNNGSSTTFSGVMSGPGSLVKIGAATLTLSGTNTYTGNTIVNAGALDVTGSLAKNDSSAVFISAGPDFGVASLVRRVQSGRSYSGFGATSSGLGMGISADLRGGRSSRASAFDLAMQWRFHDAATDGPGLISDVLSLTGMSSFSGGHVQTDPFPLQMNYNAATLGPRESMLAASGLIDLAWLNSSLNQPNGLWQNATMGNFGTGLQGDVFQNVQSSWDAFASAHSITDANVGDFLGSFGVDVAHHQVWAVVNHNSQFSVVPEPSALVLLLIGGLALSGSAVGRRRRVHGIPWFRRKGSL